MIVTSFKNKVQQHVYANIHQILGCIPSSNYVTPPNFVFRSHSVKMAVVLLVVSNRIKLKRHFMMTVVKRLKSDWERSLFFFFFDLTQGIICN